MLKINSRVFVPSVGKRKRGAIDTFNFLAKFRFMTAEKTLFRSPRRGSIKREQKQNIVDGERRCNELEKEEKNYSLSSFAFDLVAMIMGIINWLFLPMKTDIKIEFYY